MLRTRVEGGPEIAAALDGMGEEMAGKSLEIAAMTGAQLLANAWKNTVGYVTGAYKRSIHADVTQRVKGYVQVTVGTDIIDPPYPFILEYGAVITVKTAKWLTFKTKDGSWHRVKSVRIPAFGWARKAWDMSINRVNLEIWNALMAIVDKYWR